MRKSRFVARIFMLVFWGLALFSAILVVVYHLKMKEWESVGKETVWEGDPPVEVVIHRDPAYRNTDTRKYTSTIYRRYVFGRTVTGDDITDDILSDKTAEFKYDAEGRVIEVFIPPKGRPAPFKAEEFLDKFAQYRWCLIPTMEAAIFASWVWFLKWIIGIGLVVSLVIWRVAQWVSKQPLKASAGRGGRGRTYKGNPVKRFFRWIRNRRSGGGASRGRGRGRRRGRR